MSLCCSFDISTIAHWALKEPKPFQGEDPKRRIDYRLWNESEKICEVWKNLFFYLAVRGTLLTCWVIILFYVKWNYTLNNWCEFYDVKTKLELGINDGEHMSLIFSELDYGVFEKNSLPFISAKIKVQNSQSCNSHRGRCTKMTQLQEFYWTGRLSRRTLTTRRRKVGRRWTCKETNFTV